MLTIDLSPITAITLVLSLLGAQFILTTIACAFALGRMHAWLKERNEVFGDGKGLRDSIIRRVL